MAISPDGTRIVFPTQRTGGPVMLATRLMDQSKATVLSGTEEATIPFFSPDGQWIGFSAGQKLKKVSVLGGAPMALCDAPTFRGASWGEDGYIVASLGAGPLSRVPESGGTPQSLEKSFAGRAHRWPQILPGGQSALFTSGNTPTEWDDAAIEVLNLKTGQIRTVQRGGYYGRYLPSGHLVFVHQGTLFAVPFDLLRLESRGVPAPVLDDVAGSAASGGGQLDISLTGTFVYLSGRQNENSAQLRWMDASGKLETLFAGFGLTPKFSPDGKRLAAEMAGEVRVYDLERGALTPITSGSARSSYPIWAPDGKHIFYTSATGLWWTRADGS